MSESFAMCSHNDCINKYNCIRYKDIPSPYYCLLNYKQICNDDNNYQWIIKRDENIEIKKLSDIPKVENDINNTNNEGENNSNDIQQNQEEKKEAESNE